MKLGKILGKITPFLDSPIGEILTAVVPGLGAADKVLEALGVGEDEHVELTREREGKASGKRDRP